MNIVYILVKWGAYEIIIENKTFELFKVHASEIIRNIKKEKEPLIITQNGEAKVVLQDIDSYEQTQETLNLLKILALGNKQIEEGKIKPSSDVFDEIYKSNENA